MCVTVARLAGRQDGGLARRDVPRRQEPALQVHAAPGLRGGDRRQQGPPHTRAAGGRGHHDCQARDTRTGMSQTTLYIETGQFGYLKKNYGQSLVVIGPVVSEKSLSHTHRHTYRQFIPLPPFPFPSPPVYSKIFSHM